MVDLDLTPREAEILAAVLENYLSELRTEISHTDSAAYREGLREKEDILRKVVERLAPRERTARGQKVR